MVRNERRSAAKLGLASIGLALLASCEQTPPAKVVGLSFADYVDAQRPSWSSPASRPIDATLWYPAAPGSTPSKWQVAFFHGGMNAKDAPLPASPTKFPLVLISHGTGGSSVSMAWLAQSLASSGYIVAAVNHHGNTAAEPEYLVQGFALWWERARDISVLLDKISAHPTLGNRIDMQRVGVAGFSLGGYTALAVAGARIDRARWARFCADSPSDPNCTLPSEATFSMDDVSRVIDGDERARKSLARSGDSYRDERIRAAFVMAPVLAPAMDPASLSQMTIPVMVVVGDQDRQAPPDGNAVPIVSRVPRAALQRIPNGTHYMFLSTCTPLGKVIAHAICADPVGIDRDDIHRDTAERAARFFDASLGGSAASR